MPQSNGYKPKQYGQNFYFNHHDYMPRKGWGAVLKAFREDVLGIHQDEMAKLLGGVSQTMMWRVESGRRDIDVDMMIKLTNLMNAHVSVMLKNVSVLKQELKVHPNKRSARKRNCTIPHPERIDMQVNPSCPVCDGWGTVRAKENGEFGEKECFLCKLHEDGRLDKERREEAAKKMAEISAPEKRNIYPNYNVGLGDVLKEMN